MKKSTWIIVGLVLVLGLIYKITKEDKISVGVKRLSLPTFAKTTVNRIEILGKERVILEKDSGSWMLNIGDEKKPRLVDADQSNVQAVVDAAALVRHSYYVTQMKDKLEGLGLDEKNATIIKLYSNEKVIWSLALGKNAVGSGRYAKLLSDENVYVVKGSFWQLTRNGPQDFRNRQILSVGYDDLVSAKFVKNSVNHLVIEKLPDSKLWELVSADPKKTKSFRAAQSEMANLVRASVSVKAQGFVDSKMNLKKPVLSVELNDKNGELYVLQFFANTKEQYLLKKLNDEQVYEVSKYSFDRVNKNLDDLRDLSFVKFDSKLVEGIYLDSKNGDVSLVKNDDKWEIIKPKVLPKGFEFDESSVDEILSILSNLVASRIADPSKDRAVNKRWKKTPLVELTLKDGEKLKIYVSPINGAEDEVLVQGNIDRENYVIKRNKIKPLSDGLEAFRKQEFELPPIDERTKGFESLPVDIQRKLLDATKKNH